METRFYSAGIKDGFVLEIKDENGITLYHENEIAKSISKSVTMDAVKRAFYEQGFCKDGEAEKHAKMVVKYLYNK